MGTLLSSFGFRVSLTWGLYFHYLGSGPVYHGDFTLNIWVQGQSNMGTLLSSFGFRASLTWGLYFHHLGSGPV